MPKRTPRLDIVRAVHRLTQEETKLIEELAPEFGVSAPTLRRWIISGKRQIFLDGVHRPAEAWLTSREAIARFRTQVAAPLAEAGAGS